MGLDPGRSHMTTINNEVVIASWRCSRKAYLLSTTQPPPPHPYVALLDRMKERARAQVKSQHPGVTPGARFDPTKGTAVFVDVVLQSGDLQASCDFLTRLPDKTHPPRSLYEPSIVVGTHQVTAEQKLE